MWIDPQLVKATMLIAVLAGLFSVVFRVAFSFSGKTGFSTSFFLSLTICYYMLQEMSDSEKKPKKRSFLDTFTAIKSMFHSLL